MKLNAPVYGWENLDICTNLGWYKGDTTPALKNKIRGYETEHVLEWQTVTEFFNDHLSDHFKNTKFKSPDPNDTKDKTRLEVEWCSFWQTSWSFDKGEKFALQKGGPEMSPFEWIADVYPSTQKHRDEFTFLQKGSNSVKGRVGFRNKLLRLCPANRSCKVVQYR